MDESLQMLGNAVVKHWAKSFMGYAVPAESRIEGFSFGDVTVTEVEVKHGTKWIEMPYHYILEFSYSIDTASEKYLSSVDGIAGKGTFDGLYRELFVKDLGEGNIGIVNTATPCPSSFLQ